MLCMQAGRIPTLIVLEDQVIARYHGECKKDTSKNLGDGDSTLDLTPSRGHIFYLMEVGTPS